MRQYEAMFLFDQSFAHEFGNVEKEIDRVMTRADAQVIISKKWDERKLAFEIGRRKRGCYVLTYFNADPTKIKSIDHDCKLSEHILRVLILSAEGISRKHMEASYPQRATASSESGEEGKGSVEAAPKTEAALVTPGGDTVETATDESPAAPADESPVANDESSDS